MQAKGRRSYVIAGQVGERFWACLGLSYTPPHALRTRQYY